MLDFKGKAKWEAWTKQKGKKPDRPSDTLREQRIRCHMLFLLSQHNQHRAGTAPAILEYLNVVHLGDHNQAKHWMQYERKHFYMQA